MPITAEQQPDAQAQSWVRTQLHTALLQTGLRLADMYVVSDIECHGHEVRIAGQRWYDVGHLFDPREVSSDMIEIWSQAIAYALSRRLIEMHPDAPNLLRKVVQS